MKKIIMVLTLFMAIGGIFGIAQAASEAITSDQAAAIFQKTYPDAKIESNRLSPSSYNMNPYYTIFGSDDQNYGYKMTIDAVTGEVLSSVKMKNHSKGYGTNSGGQGNYQGGMMGGNRGSGTGCCCN